MSNKTVTLTTILIGLMMLTSLAEAAPNAFQARYAVVKSGLTLGEMTATLKVSGNSYNYQKLTQANGLAALVSGDRLTEQVQGRINGNAMLPSSYLRHHKSRRKERRDQYQFTSPTQLRGQYDNKNYQLTVPQGTIDPVTMELRIMEDVRANRPLRYTVSEKGEVKDYTLRLLGNETISVPAGRYQAVKVQVIHNSSNRQTILWLAPQLNYVPIKIRHNEEGDIIETQLSSYQAR